MKYYILFYETVENYVEKRAPYRSVHLANAKAAVDRGEIIMGGAFDEPADGVAIVFKVNEISIITNFVEEDPYVQNGLISKWWIRPWNVVVGTAL